MTTSRHRETLRAAGRSGAMLSEAGAASTFNLCLDCNADTYQKKEHTVFLIKDAIRKKTKLRDGEGSLCLDCLEKRIGRKLRRSDINDSSLEFYSNPQKLQLLSERLHGHFQPRAADFSRNQGVKTK
jgi:hypothetical protein